MKSMIATLTATLVLSVNFAYAASDLTITSLLNSKETAALFDKMLGAVEQPAWLTNGAVQAPALNAKLGEKNFSVMTACKAHNCASEKVAVMYNSTDKLMYGVIYQANETITVETLHWLNIGGGDESIDGKTILYAALTGSLDNHPDAFDF